MKHQIITIQTDKSLLWRELNFLVSYFIGKNITTCEICFGFAWGNEYYPSNEWVNEKIQLEKIASKIIEIEALGLGKFGSDDLYLDFPNFQFQFCHESDIHLIFESAHANEETEFFYNRWLEVGLKPSEWLKSKIHEIGEKIR
jgi:hypothetical protein